MKIFLLFLTCLALISCQDSQQPGPPITEIIMEVGNIIPGKIDAGVSNQVLHYLKVNKVEQKFLFFRISTYDTVATELGIYSNETREIIHQCQHSVDDSCYVPARLLKENATYIVLIQANQNIQYNLYTYWGNLEHIQPNQEIKFMFDPKNTTQLFHLELKDFKFEQVRIVLRPETLRSEGDSLRIYANLGLKEEPTSSKHDFRSTQVWGDAEAILLSKTDLKGQTDITLYIVGNAETVYIFECELVETASHSLHINETLHEFLPKAQETYYEMSFKENNNVDAFVIKLAVFSGEVEVAFYYDRQFSRPYEKLPYQYMSDMQFNFDRSDFDKGTNEIFMKMRCPDSPAVYQILTQTRTKSIAFEITENVYEFSVLNTPQEAMYFYSRIFDNNQFDLEKIFKFDVSIIKIAGNIKFEFYACKPEADIVKCRDINDAAVFKKSTNQLTPTGTEQVGSKLIYTLEMKKDLYEGVNQVEKQLMIVVLAKRVGNGETAYAIEYSNNNQVRLLREGRAFEDKVKIQEKKFYKYVNNNPSASEIRIHINEISGYFKIRAQRENIVTTQGVSILPDKENPDTIIIKDRLTEPIYIEISGQVTSIFALSVSSIHPEHVVSNALVMAEDLEYEVKLIPYQHMNVELHPIEGNIIFEFYSEGGPVVVCEVDLSDVCKGESLAGSHGEIKINAQNSREIRLRIGNFIDGSALAPSSSSLNNAQLPTSIVRKVKLTLIYHGETNEHCDERKLNKVYSENIKSGSCFKFHLPLAEDIHIMSSRSDLGQTFQFFYVCSSKVVPSIANDRQIITADQIKSLCATTPHDIVIETFVSDPDKNLKDEIKMEYSVEYGNDVVSLTDGVAYPVKTNSLGSDQSLRTFFYEIIDEDRDINIVLYNKKGNQKFLGNIANKPDRYSATIVEYEATINSKNSSYYNNPYLKVETSAIAAANCGRTCVMVISIYSKEPIGDEIEFALEITQNHIVLKEDQIKKGFLTKGSAEFYEFESRKSNGSLIFQVSDNNRKCAKAILSKSPFPTASNYYVKENSGLIVYPKTSKGTYYFAVEAIEDCPFSVTVSEGETNITKIEHGQFYDIKLKEGQEKWFYLRQVANQTFKISSLQSYGTINLYANQTELNKDTLINLQNNQINKKNFNFKSSTRSTLIVDQKSRDFCSNCYYLIGVHANENTEGSIYIGSESSKIGLTEEKTFFDEIINKNSTTFATFHKVSDGNIAVKVHSGKIKIEMTYTNQKFEKSFSANKKGYNESYSFSRDDYKFNPLEIRITAEQVPAVYSLEIIPKTESFITNRKVSPGEPTYLFLEKGSVDCLSGKLTSKEEEIFISVDNTDVYSLESLQLELALNGINTTNFTKEIVGNILSIRINSEIEKLPVEYKLCLKTETKNESVSIFAFQDENVNLIHSDTENLVRKESQYIIYPNGPIILDLFECRGKAEIFYGSDLEKLKEKESHTLDIIGGINSQSHAIKITEYFSALYFDIVSEIATILWMPLSEENERGIGYFKYKIGDLGYSSNFNNINFNIGGVYQDKKTATKVKKVKYTLFVSNSKEILQQAVNCEKYVQEKLVTASITTDKVGENKTLSLDINLAKNKITSQFSDNETLYFNVAAAMTLETPEQNNKEVITESYKFIYNPLQVPSEVFRQNKIEVQVGQVSSLKIEYLILLAVVVLVIFLLIAYVFVKFVVPAIGKLRHRVLVEEKEDPKDQSIPIPQSSDRNQIERAPPSTEDEMKD